MNKESEPRALALLPLLLFLLLFAGAGVYYSLSGVDFAFYQLKAPVVALLAIGVALLIGRDTINHQVETLVAGMGDPTIVLMALIYLLAGAFATLTGALGGVDAAVQLGLALLPEQLVLPGLFVIAALLATAMGTSMGTIGAVAPIAVGMASATQLSLPLVLGAVIGGAMFGDNLSIISDTTIAATRSQGVSMRDKFRVNLRIALPAALVTVVVLALLGSDAQGQPGSLANAYLALPYLVVLVAALAGVNVVVVLLGGMLLSALMALTLADLGPAAIAGEIYKGFSSMQEILLLSLLIGGLSALMRRQGGLAWIMAKILWLASHSRLGANRTGELAISLLVALANLFVANNTVAIVLTGPVARRLAESEGVEARRSASMLDIFACVVQGMIPHGAQILLAASLGGISPLLLVGEVHYCWLLGVAALWAIARTPAHHRQARLPS